MNRDLKPGTSKSFKRQKNTKPREPKVQIGKASVEVLEQRLQEYTERTQLLDSRRTVNGGIGLMPDTSSELSWKTKKIEQIKEELERRKNEA